MADASFSLAVFRIWEDVELIRRGDDSDAYVKRVADVGSRGGKLLGRIEVSFHPGSNSFETAAFPADQAMIAVAHRLADRLAAGDLFTEGEGDPTAKRSN